MYVEITGDEAIAHIISHTAGTGHEIGEEADVTKAEIKDFKANIISADYLENDDSWISIEQYPTTKKGKNLKKYINSVYEGYNFDEYEYEENEYDSKYYRGKYTTDSGGKFEVIVTIKYGIACIVTVFNNESQANSIANTIEITKDNIGMHAEGIESIRYEIPDNFCDYSDSEYDYYEFLVGSSCYGFQVMAFETDLFEEYSLDEFTEVVSAVYSDISSKEKIETDAGSITVFVGTRNGKEAYSALLEYDGFFYTFDCDWLDGKESDEVYSMFEAIIESLSDREE